MVILKKKKEETIEKMFKKVVSFQLSLLLNSISQRM